MAAFNRGEWISCDKKWKDVPKSIRQVCHNDFLIPEMIAATILPDAGISIHALLDFHLPRPTTAVRDASDCNMFFSKYAADTVDASMIQRLRHLDMPTATVIRQLFQNKNQMWLDGFTSIKYAHLSGDTVTHFPLWVISFWNDITDIRFQVRKPWTDARDWVKKQMEQKKKPDVRVQATDVSKLLGILPWKGNKRGLSNNEPIHTLSRYLGPEWLSSTDEDDMLELLRDRIASDPELTGSVRVEGVDFTSKITAAFKEREQLDYFGSNGSRWLRTLGNDVFGHGERLVTIAHLGVHNKKKHWVALEVDGPQRLFRYGDSCGDAIPPTLREAYEWWMACHTADSIQFESLPTSEQTDGHSCGMLAANAAERAIYPETPLLAQADVPRGRLQMFSRLTNRVLDRVSPIVRDCVAVNAVSSRLRMKSKRSWKKRIGRRSRTLAALIRRSSHRLVHFQSSRTGRNSPSILLSPRPRT
jgi:hypothetical protein